MITLSEFFEINHDVILFAYGLVFFTLGLTILIRIRQSSRLELARSLKWMAAFGILHGLNEWGDLFIPLQAVYLSPLVMRGLYIGQLIILTLSFAALFEFGVTVLNSIGQAKYLKGFAGMLTAGWAIGSFILFIVEGESHQEWQYISIALSRYFIGFPGGILAAYGLRAYTIRRIDPLNVPQIAKTFQIAGYFIALYAVLGGLIPPPVSFFPGNILNSNTFTQATGIPPWVFRTMVAAIITIAITRALEIFELETDRRIEELEQQQIVATERERYARELHDGTIQKVYTAGLLVESASRIADPKTEISKRLERAVGILNDTIADLRQNLVELHAHTPTETESLTSLLHKLADNPHYNTLIDIQLDLLLPSSKQLSSRRKNHVVAIVAEALANAVRHAQAQKVLIAAKDLGKNLQITIRDNGTGLPKDLKAGYGLSNMRDRTRLLNGAIDCKNEQGANITITIPWADEKI